MTINIKYFHYKHNGKYTPNISIICLINFHTFSVTEANQSKSQEREHDPDKNGKTHPKKYSKI